MNYKYFYKKMYCVTVKLIIKSLNEIFMYYQYENISN